MKKNNDDWMESDPDWIKVKQEARKKHPNYPLEEILNEIEIHLRYGLPRLKLIGWTIVILLALILVNMK